MAWLLSSFQDTVLYKDGNTLSCKIEELRRRLRFANDEQRQSILKEIKSY